MPRAVTSILFPSPILTLISEKLFQEFLCCLSCLDFEEFQVYVQHVFASTS